jgi:ribulose kinase
LPPTCAAAILGGVAAGMLRGIPEAMAAMSHAGRIVEPSLALRSYHDAKYAVFQRMHDDQLAYRNLMAEPK